jgi:hypothetical protein
MNHFSYLSDKLFFILSLAVHLLVPVLLTKTSAASEIKAFALGLARLTWHFRASPNYLKNVSNKYFT